MTLQTKIDNMRNLLIRRVEINTDIESLTHLRELVENDKALFEDCQEWDDIGMSLLAKPLALMKVDDWYLKACEACEKNEPIPTPPIGELMIDGGVLI